MNRIVFIQERCHKPYLSLFRMWPTEWWTYKATSQCSG